MEYPSFRREVASTVKSILGFESRAVDASSFLGPFADLLHTHTAARKHVTRETALELSPVWGAVRILSDGVATLPLNAHIRTSGVRRPFTRPGWMNFDQGPWSKIDIIGQAMVSLLLEGNAYIATYRDEMGQVLYLEVLDPTVIEPEKRGSEIVYKVEGLSTIFTRNDILHIRGMTLPGAIKGLSPITYQRETIALGLAAQEFGAAFFGNGALPGAVIESEGPISEPGQRAIKAGWDSLFRGSANASKIAILTNGAKLSKITINPNEAQFLETRAFQVNDIARIYGVPVNLLQHSDGPEMGQSLSDKNTHFVQHSLRTWVERLEYAFSWLMWSEGSPRQAFAKFNIDGLLRGDFETRYETYSSAVIQGILTINEVRALEDMPPVPWGETPISVQVEEDQDKEDESQDSPPTTEDTRSSLDSVDGIDPIEAATLLQKLYLATPNKVVVSTEEARRLARKAGIDLDVIIPEELVTAPPPVALEDEPEDEEEEEEEETEDDDPGA